MVCRILKDAKSGEEFLIPGCESVMQNWNQDEPLREIIKTYCNCHREKRDKYETKSRDEVFQMIEELKGRIVKQEHEIEKMKQELDCLESEVFMLNVVEVYPKQKA